MKSDDWLVCGAGILCAGCASIAGLDDYAQAGGSEGGSSSATLAGGGGAGGAGGGATGGGGLGGSHCMSTADTPYSLAVMASDPIAYLRFEQSSGPMTADELCQHPGQAFGEHTFGVQGLEPGGRAIGLAGGYVDIASTPQLQFAGNEPYSIELWVYFEAFEESDMLVGKSQNDAGWSFARQVINSSDDWRAWRCGAGDCDSIPAPVMNVQLATWHHLVTTYDGTVVSLHVDGVVVGVGPTSRPVDATGNPVRIGNAAMNERALDGRVDEVAIYDRALDETEVTEHFNAPR